MVYKYMLQLYYKIKSSVGCFRPEDRSHMYPNLQLSLILTHKGKNFKIFIWKNQAIKKGANISNIAPLILLSKKLS